MEVSCHSYTHFNFSLLAATSSLGMSFINSLYSLVIVLLNSFLLAESEFFVTPSISGEEIDLPPSGLGWVTQYHKRNKFTSLTLVCEGLTPKPAVTKMSQADLPSHCPSSSAFTLTSSEKDCISSKAAFNRVLGFLGTCGSLLPRPDTPPGLNVIALASLRDW